MLLQLQSNEKGPFLSGDNVVIIANLGKKKGAFGGGEGDRGSLEENVSGDPSNKSKGG